MSWPILLLDHETRLRDEVPSTSRFLEWVRGGVDTARGQELADLDDFVLGEVMRHIRECGRMPIQGDADAISSLAVDGGAEAFEHVHYVVEVDIGAQRMSVQSVQGLPVPMIH
jgi:hypothetical protein